MEWTFIYLPILYHTIYGIWIILTGQPNANRYGYAMNWAYLAQRASAIILVAFIAFHVFSMKGWFGSALTFDPTKATQTTVNHFHAHWWVGYLVYPIGILAATVSSGERVLYAAITWGLTISAGAQRAAVGIRLLRVVSCRFNIWIDRPVCRVARHAGLQSGECRKHPRIARMSEALDILVARYANGGERLISVADGMNDAERRRVPPADAPGDIGRWSYSSARYPFSRCGTGIC